MSAAQIRILESFPEPEFTALRTTAFSDFGEASALLPAVLADEAQRRSQVTESESLSPTQLRIGAFIDNRLVGWSYSECEGRQLHTIHSGVHPDFRSRGIYADLVRATINYADAHAFLRIISRHVPSNNAVIIPKLRLGFLVSAFEYSEVYGPVIHLTYLVGKLRRELYRVRATPIVPSGEAGSTDGNQN